MCTGEAFVKGLNICHPNLCNQPLYIPWSLRGSENINLGVSPVNCLFIYLGEQVFRNMTILIRFIKTPLASAMTRT